MRARRTAGEQIRAIRRRGVMPRGRKVFGIEPHVDSRSPITEPSASTRRVPMSLARSICDCLVVCAAVTAAGCAVPGEPDDTQESAVTLVPTSLSSTPVGYGAATTGGGNKAAVAVSTMAAMQAAIDAYDGTSGLVLNYTGVFNFGTIPDPCTQWTKTAQIVQIKKKNNITVLGANGSSANFGIHIAGPSSNVIVRNMIMGLLSGGSNADSISIEGMSSGVPSNIWIDHNTIFASLTECSNTNNS